MPEGEFYGEEDDLPELFDSEEREEVAFHSFDKNSDKATNFKKSLLCFSDVENYFFYAVIYGLMYEKLKRQNLLSVLLENVQNILGKDFFIKLK